MQMCQAHWDMLREEVIALGMGDLISGNGEIVVMKMTSELQGDPDSKDNFDPLMRCHWMIFNRALDIAGIASLSEEFGCPICRFNEARNPDGSCGCNDPQCGGKFPGAIPDHETWLAGPDGAPMAVKQMCVEKGWL